jgi:hypothetical protein
MEVEMRRLIESTPASKGESWRPFLIENLWSGIPLIEHQSIDLILKGIPSLVVRSGATLTKA